MPEIQCLSIFPAILTLSRSTDINVHLPTYVGTDDGISGLDLPLYFQTSVIT